MKRVAIFVDAGYLYAAGSALLTGSKKNRKHLSLKKSAAIDCLKVLSLNKAPAAELLRIYWYDGASGTRGPSSEQLDLAYRDDIKVRLGFINSHGEQKGVDSLIVTDLIELGRNRSITDAVLLAGDEDLRVGVQMAQNFGVRVHLLGIHPCRGNQSNQLLQEVDTCSCWPKEQIAKILEYTSPDEGNEDTRVELSADVTDIDKINKIVDSFYESLGAEKIREIETFFAADNSIPREYDAQFLGKCREALGRTLEQSETRHMRTRLRSKLK